MSDAPRDRPANAIAIIGMAGRFPGARSADELWQLVRDGREAIRRLTDEDLRAAGESPDVAARPNYVRAAATLDDFDRFDAGFFGLSPRDAAIMDPQHRHFLEVAWEALERAGYTPESFAGSIGVFGGCGMQAYFAEHLLRNARVMGSAGLFLVRHTGNDKDFLSTRVSYQLNLRGPSINVQTACSTSLVAVHLACQSLLGGECDMALAGGATIELPHGRGYLYEEGEILSPDGHCRAFDAASKGTVFGSGAGMVVLRRLEDALADDDHIHAVILASAVNNDGAGKVGYLAPSVDGQAAVIAEAIALSGVDAASIGYIEAHGTGTPVGDPIEVAALTEAFRRSTDRRAFCALGSIKTNIGHLDTAAGVASLIKAASVVEHGEMPATLHFEQPNPSIPFADTPFFVNARLTPWSSPGPRRAGVTSLGVGGTNAHVIVEEPPLRPATAGKTPNLLVWSARSAASADRMTGRLAAHCAAHPDLPIADAAWTLQTGRRTFDHRRAVVAASSADAAAALRAPARRVLAGERMAPTPSVVFLFPGGGAQYPNMAREIYDREPVFRQALDHGFNVLERRNGLALRPLLFPEPHDAAAAAAALEQSTHAILAVFLVEYALVRLWESWGVRPDAMTGHSLGEYTAACVAGVFSFEDALAIVKARGDVFAKLPAGGMTSVPLPERDVAPLLPGTCGIAAVNAPELTVVSGAVPDLEALEAALAHRGVEYRRLHIAVAAHSAMLDPYLAEFERQVRLVPLSKPTVPFISNVTGTWADADAVATPEYWVRHLRQPVRFADGIATMLAQPSRLVVEMGPGHALSTFVRAQAPTAQRVVAAMRHPKDPSSDLTTLYNALAQAWIAGVTVDWLAFNGGTRGRKVPLPTYSFDHERYWIEPDAAPSRSENGDAAIASPEASWYSAPQWTPRPLPDRPARTATSFLVLLGPDGVGDALAQALRARGATVVGVRRGGHFSRDDSGYTVRPGEPADYQAVLAAVREGGAPAVRIVHTWLSGPAVSPAASVARAIDDGFTPLLLLGQALAREADSTIDGIIAVTRATERVTDEPVLSPESALLHGPVLVIPQELGIACTVVDLDDAVSIDALAAECASDLADRKVAWRAETRFVERLASVPEPAAGSVVGLVPHGVYLLTGGFGGIGRAVAEYLARAYGARLIFVARHEPRDSRAFAHLIHALGGEMLFCGADVTDETAVGDAVEAGVRRFGRVDGAFHMAGVIADDLIAEKDVAASLRVLAPKVHGTLALERALTRAKADFLVLFSSTSAHLGLPGQVDYTAANAFLNAFARSRMTHQGSCRVLAVGWGVWKDAGMAARAAGVDARWIGPEERATSDNALLGPDRSQSPERAEFTTTLDPRRLWLLDEHRLATGEAVLPGAAFLTMAASAAMEVFGRDRFEVRDLEFTEPLVFPGDRPREVRVSIPRAGRVRPFVIATAPVVPPGQPREWVDHARGVVLRYPSRPTRLRLDRVRDACQTPVAADAVVRPQGRYLRFGPHWHATTQQARSQTEAVARLELSPAYRGETTHSPLHPALLDLATTAGLHLLPALEKDDGLYVPLGYGRVRVFRPLPASIWSHVRLVRDHQDQASFDVAVFDESGRLLLEAYDFTVRRISPTTFTSRKRAESGSAAGLSPARAWVTRGIDVATGPLLLDALLSAETQPEIVVSSIPVDLLFVARPASRHSSSGLAAGAGTGGDDAPSGDAERELARMWQELLGVESVGANEDFFELGGHSLIALRLVNRIEKRFHTRIKLATLFEARTIRQLAVLLGGGGTSSAFASLVAIQPSGSKPPLFVVHAVGGEVLSYSELSRLLGPDQPFFAFRSVGHDGSRPLLETIEEQAAFYISEMRQQQPNGPYYLAGYSHGGRVAFEMAQQLTKQGEQVAFVGVLDTWPVEGLPRGPQYLLAWLANLPKWFAADLATMGWRGNFERLGRVLKARIRRWRKPDTASALEANGPQLGDAMQLGDLPPHIRQTYETNFKAFLRYRPSYFDGTVTLFRASAQPLGGPHGRDLGWGRFAAHVEVIDVPGNHGGLLSQPDVRDLARHLRERLAARSREAHGL